MVNDDIPELLVGVKLEIRKQPQRRQMAVVFGVSQMR